MNCPQAGVAAWIKPSFGKEHFLGNFRLDLVHPQPELTAAAVKKVPRTPGG
jgi:hypothetical protein